MKGKGKVRVRPSGIAFVIEIFLVVLEFITAVDRPEVVETMADLVV